MLYSIKEDSWDEYTLHWKNQDHHHLKPDFFSHIPEETQDPRSPIKMKEIEDARKSEYPEYDCISIVQVMCPYHRKEGSYDYDVDDSQWMHEK